MENNYQTFEIHPDYHPRFDQNFRIMQQKQDHWQRQGVMQGESYEKGDYTFHPLEIENTPVLLIRNPKENISKVRIANKGLLNRKTRKARSLLEKALDVPLKKAA